MNKTHDKAMSTDQNDMVNYYREDVFGKGRYVFKVAVLSAPWTVLLGATSSLAFPVDRLGWVFAITSLMILGTWLVAISGKDDFRNVVFQTRRLIDLFAIAYVAKLFPPFGLLLAMGLCIWFGTRVLSITSAYTTRRVKVIELLI